MSRQRELQISCRSIYISRQCGKDFICLFLWRHSISLMCISFENLFSKWFVLCLSILIKKIKTKQIKIDFFLESWIFIALASNKFNDLLKCFFFFPKGFLLCIHSRACFKMASFATRNREKEM